MGRERVDKGAGDLWEGVDLAGVFGGKGGG